MPKSKTRKSKKNNNRTPIAGHHQAGKKLVPPIPQIMGEKLELKSWMNGRLPEMLWVALILASTERNEAFNEFNRILNFVSGHQRKTELEQLTISGISNLEVPLRQEVIGFITDNRRTAQALATLKLFDSLPSKDDWDKTLSDFEPSEPLLMTAVGNTLFHQSQASTDCRWFRTANVGAAGMLFVNPDLVDYIEALKNYPNLELGAPEGARIRAGEIGLSSFQATESEWPSAFWQEAWEKTPCLELGTPQEEQVQLSTTRQQINQLMQNLKEHWTQTHSTTAIDAKHDALFGMAFYALQMLTEMMAFGISNGILSRLGLRTILEVRINLKYLIDDNTGELWKKWRQYGTGQAKLSSLKLDDLSEPPQYIDVGGLEHIASEDLWEELLTIDVGNWANGDLRKISQQANMKDTYDQHYPWTSTYAHGMWGAIRESSYHTCGNPLHRLHRYLEKQPLKDCLYNATSLVDEIIEHIDNEYPPFPHRLLKPN